MAKAAALKGRYELKDILGRGGMGVVYRAYDYVLKCDVALKTLRESPDPTALQLFYRECEVLTALNHPNIVQILDIGEFEDEGRSKPYFVMPLLPGVTLDKLIRSAGSQLTVQRRVEILSQVCRGLHAAHERGLIHRDIKPGNILVMPDFSAEIIDFGVAHMINAGTTGQKGTPFYMAPELLQSKPPTVLSDIFALGATAFELFTRRRPFERTTERELIEAILHENPPPASDLDPAVNEAISRVLHKSLAKQPWHRFVSVRDFGECLEKAHRGEPIDYFDAARTRPRIQRARAAFEQGDYQFTIEIVSELEAEGHLDPDLALLKRQVDIAIRHKRIGQLLESARSRLEGEEYPLALQKVQEVLTLEPDNAEAIILRSRIEGVRGGKQIEGWLRLARQHIDNHAFSHAREALQNVLQVRPQDTRASGLLSEVDRKEQEYLRNRQEKEQLYQAAVEAYQKGDVTAALTKLQRVLEVDRIAPDTSHQERGTAYQNFYNQVRSEYDAIQSSYAEARQHLDHQEFAKALAICEQYLKKYPGHALFQALKFDAQEQHRLQLSAYIAETDRRVEAETDLERKVNIVRDAMERFPNEPHFEHLFRIMNERLHLVLGIVARARYHEERGQFSEALGQWEILRTIHAGYPGLQFEMERLTKRRDQQAHAESKARWVQKIDCCLEAGDYASALQLAGDALEEFPGDGELLAFREAAIKGEERRAQAKRLQAEGERLLDEGDCVQGLAAFRQARAIDARCGAIEAGLLDRLVERAQSLRETDPLEAESLIGTVLELDPSHAAANSIRQSFEDLRRQELLNQAISRIRQLQAAGDFQNGLFEAQQALLVGPNDPRLLQIRSKLESKVLESETAPSRRRDLDRLRAIAAMAEMISDPADIRSNLDAVNEIAKHYPDDREFQSIVDNVQRRLGAGKGTMPAVEVPERALAAGAASGLAPFQETTRFPLPPPVPAAASGPAPFTEDGTQLFKVPEPAPKAPRRSLDRILVVTAAAVLIIAAAAWFSTGTRPAAAKPPPRVLPASVPAAPEKAVVPAPPPAPVAPKLRVFLTDLKDCKVTLDGAVLDPAIGVELSNDGNTPAKHTLLLENGADQAAIVFTTAADALPAIEPVVASGGLQVVVTGAFHERAVVQSNLGLVKAQVDHQEPVKMDSTGLEVSNLASGVTHELHIGEGDSARTVDLDSGTGPTLNVFVSAGITTGNVSIRVSGADDAHVLVDGIEKGVTRNGRRRLNMEPGPHEIQVRKEGFVVDPAEPQKIVVQKGGKAALSFGLTPLRMFKVDNQRRTTGPLVLIPDSQTVTGSSAEDPLRKITGAKRQPVTYNMNAADWDGAWKKEGEELTQKAGGFIFYRRTPAIGVFHFTARAKNKNPFGTAKLRWVLDYLDNKNYVVFELDKQSYRRTEIHQETAHEGPQQKLSGIKSDPFDVEITVEPNRISVKVASDSGALRAVDGWTPSSLVSTKARFGFNPPHQMWLRSFTFTQSPAP